MTLRVLYNVVLCRLGIRKIFPRNYVNSMQVKECGEELVKFQDFYVRKGVAERLQRAECSLGAEYGIKVVSGYRTLEEQQLLWAKAGGNSRFSANPANGQGGGHQTGGAVDVILLKNGREVDMGTAYAEHSCKVLTDSKAVNKEQQAARAILCNAMREAGFVNYPAEWWHFCYGDRMWAAYKNKKFAIYDTIL